MKRIAGGLTRCGRQLAVAVVVGLAVVTALSAGDESKAQSLQLPRVTVPQVGVPAVTVPPVTVPPVRVDVPPIGVPETQVQTPPVTVTTPPVTTPQVRTPPVTTPQVKTPQVTTPPVQTPSVQSPRTPTPSLPSIPNVRTPSPGGDGRGATAGASPSPSGGPGAPADPAGATTGSGPAARASLGLPSASELRNASPQRRRELLRRVWDAPLRDARLRRLRETILDHRGCLGTLPEQGRRTLVLRAGLNGAEPASRRAIARRLGVSLARELRVESTALRRLTSAGERGLCGGAGSTVAAGGSVRSQELPASTPAPDGDGAPVVKRGEVLGVAERGGASNRAPRLGIGDGAEGASGALFFLALALLGPLAAAILATRVRGGGGAPAAPPTVRDERPLLFLDVDGVLALSPTASRLPRGRLYELGFGATYVSDDARTLVGRLASRFELVWATGWEHHANRGLALLLGLEQELPVLTFGRKARYGSAEWKTKRVGSYAGERPAAWIDDNFDASHERWARRRSAPTLLVPTDPSEGITAWQVDALLEWADALDTAATRSGLGAPAVSRP